MAKHLPGTVKSKRFDFTLDDDDFKEHTRGFVLATTAADTQKCIKLFEDCIETRKKDGRHYPPKTNQHYLMGIQRHIRLQNQSNINLMSDPEFLPLRNLLDCLYQKLYSVGIGTSVRKTEVLDDEDDEKFWASGVLNPDTPQGLLNCVFFLNGKNFCLR